MRSPSLFDGASPPILLCRYGAPKDTPYRFQLVCVIEVQSLSGYAWLTHSPIVGKPVTLHPSIRDVAQR